jgi:NAD-dependent dihydropyrimidine dehydrogenase PreA subunit
MESKIQCFEVWTCFWTLHESIVNHRQDKCSECGRVSVHVMSLSWTTSKTIAINVDVIQYTSFVYLELPPIQVLWLWTCFCTRHESIVNYRQDKCSECGRVSVHVMSISWTTAKTSAQNVAVFLYTSWVYRELPPRQVLRMWTCFWTRHESIVNYRQDKCSECGQARILKLKNNYLLKQSYATYSNIASFIVICLNKLHKTVLINSCSLILKKQDVRMWIGLKWLKIGCIGGLFLNGNEPSGSTKGMEFTSQ